MERMHDETRMIDCQRTNAGSLRGEHTAVYMRRVAATHPLSRVGRAPAKRWRMQHARNLRRSRYSDGAARRTR
jgi:hypothetical protein